MKMMQASRLRGRERRADQAIVSHLGDPLPKIVGAAGEVVN
jgi:hypothetical protein